MTVEQLLETARSEDLERLRWRLCRMFCVAPWSKLGRALGEEDCLALAAQMVLDGEPFEAHRGGNPNFDGRVFQLRKGAGL